MIPGIHVHAQPGQLHVYARGTQGTGAIPGAGATFNVPMFSTAASQLFTIMNPADNTTRDSIIVTATHGLRRHVGLWYLDVFLFQDGPATISLRERPPDLLTQGIVGLTDTTRLVWERQVRTNVSFHQRWHPKATEVRIVYLNGATAITTFALDIIARAA